MPPSGVYNVFELSTSGGVVSYSVSPTTSSSITSVSATTTATAVAANTARKGLIAYSCSGSANTAIVSYSTAVTSISFSLAINPGAYWEMPVPLSLQGLGIAVSTTNTGGSATVLVTELT